MKSIQTFAKSYTPVYIFPFLLVAAFVYQLPFNYSPYFFAEDGYYLFRESLELGWYSIFMKLIGSFLLIPRLIAYGISFLPVEWAPHAYPIAASFIGVLVLSWFSRPGYRWIIKCDLTRTILCFIFIFLPGAGSLLVILCTLNWILFLGILLLLLEKKNGDLFYISTTRVVLISLMILSSPQSILIFPLIIYFAIKLNSRIYIFLIFIILIQAAINITGSFEHSNDFPIITNSFISIINLIRVFFESIIIRTVLVPLFGGLLTLEFLELDIILVYAIGTSIIVAFVYTFIKNTKSFDLFFWSAVISFFAICSLLPLTYIVRYYVRENMLLPLPIALGERYSFIPALTTLVFYVAWLERLSLKSSAIKNMLFLLIAINLISPAESYNSKSGHLKRVNLEWSSTAKKIRKALDQRKQGLINDPIRIAIACEPPKWKDCHNPIIIK